jgi:16S rRNA (cytosine1402-N4)-methyltransferase
MTLTMSLPTHIPVLINEAIEALQVKPGKRYIDCTMGMGGHSEAILEKCTLDGGRLLGIDADTEAIKVAAINLAYYSGSTLFINDNFSNLEKICRENEFLQVDGILFDLGISSAQLEDAERGFSFQYEAQPDMRFSDNQVLTATDLINILPESRLAQLIYEYGEEHHSRQIARLIVKNRPVVSTINLAQIIELAVGGRQTKIHPATKTFQALRIAVNHELENLEGALNQATNCLNRKGRLVVISYHSLEDRIVKQFMKRETMSCLCPAQVPVCNCGHSPTFKLISKKVITPTSSEVEKNSRSRSAKLRVVERL